MTTATVSRMQDEVRALARERDAVILAHNYQIPDIQDQLCRSASRAFHLHHSPLQSSLNDTMSTSSVTVNFKYTSPALVFGR